MSGGSEQSKTESSQDVWAPWSEAMAPMLQQSGAVFDPAFQGIQDQGLQDRFTERSQGVADSTQEAWQQQMNGGNLAGYDIAGGLQKTMNDTPQIIANNYGASLNQANTYRSSDANVNRVGPVNQSWSNEVYNDRVGPGGSSAQMNDMYRRQAGITASDMLAGMDARAAASGMSGGSRHGIAIGRGYEGINNTLQDNMANTAYDAYNRDLDRQLGIAGQTDQFNQQRAMSDQSATNQFRAMNNDSRNQARATNASAMNQAGLANQAAMNRASQANQGMDMTAQQANQASSQQQQQLMAGLLQAQNSNQQGAISSSDMINAQGGNEYQAAMAPYMAYSQMLQGMGPATVLNQSKTDSSAARGGLL